MAQYHSGIGEGVEVWRPGDKHPLELFFIFYLIQTRVVFIIPLLVVDFSFYTSIWFIDEFLLFMFFSGKREKMGVVAAPMQIITSVLHM